ncbi:hypothetical protein TNCV_1907821 [Trichonephila clavipes]|nr:hypothetical protein TNCV_1907821 [Trichonephila clavipes]
MLAKGERAYSLVDERQRGKRRLRQGEKLNFRCRKARETRPLYVEAEPELREWYCLSSRKYPGKGPISDMQYYGVGRHHDQWPHAPTCGCEWDYDGPTIH